MRRATLKIPVILAICAYGGFSRADEVFFSQPPLNGGDSFLSEISEQYADNFSPNATGLLTSIRWWGTYFSGTPEPDQFTVRFYAGGTIAPDRDPTNEFTSLSVTRTDSGLDDAFGDPIFRYEAQLPAWLEYSAGSTAYFSVLNSTVDGWFWQKSSNTGSHWFRFDDPDSWITVDSGSLAGDLAFELLGVTKATYSGTKFHDLNANGVKDAGEAVLPGWTINLAGANGAGQAVNLSTTTNASGNYSFNVAPGSYSVSETLQSGWFHSTPASGVYNTNLTSGQVSSNNLFGNYQNGTASGMNFHDLNANGVKDSGEPALSGWTINLAGANGAGQAVNLSTTTNASGNYSFSVAPGSYTISEVLPSNWLQSAPSGGVFDLLLASGQVLAGNNFANYQLSMPGDYNGDFEVDIDDYNLWRQTFGSTTELGADGNGNDVVDAADYVAWRKHRGTMLGTSLSARAVVPEPISLALMLYGISLSLVVRGPRLKRLGYDFSVTVVLA